MSEQIEWFIDGRDVIAERWNKAAKDGSKWDRTLDRDGVIKRLSEADEMEQTIATQAAEIERLERLVYHQTGGGHPFTCGNNSSHRPLFIQDAFLLCHDCDWAQDWPPASLEGSD